MLPVIIWSPLEQHGARVSNECPNCKQDGICTQLRPVGWTDGQSDNTRPRLLYCVNSNVLLISRVYCCECDHRILAHHPDILHQFSRSQLSCLVPFHLWHIAGFTTFFMDYVDHAFQAGISIQQVENMCSSNRIRLFYALKEKFEKSQLILPHCEQHTFPNYDDGSIHFWAASPTRHAIAACFLHMFWQREILYHFRMTSISLSSGNPWLSCDHTFRSVSNIGTVRQADKHWIKQYNGLFCVLNADGHVLSWKMTKSLSFEHIKDC